MRNDDLKEKVNELQEKYAALVHEHERLKHSLTSPNAEIKLAIFDRLPMAVWACDRDCRIVFWNEAATRVYGYAAEEAVGKDFVELFVNPPERAKARVDCVEIIDRDHPIKNMAEDIDKHGNTHRLVTQCFAIYNVQGHPGLQAEISYEVQDIERLQEELVRIQGEFKEAEIERENLKKQLVSVTRDRAIAALASVVTSAKADLAERREATNKAALMQGYDATLISKARAEINAEKSKLLDWERVMRNAIMSETNYEELESIISTIERNETFNS
jgi:PAS domain S-box-containing protein